MNRTVVLTSRARTFPRSDTRCDLAVGKVLVRHTEVALEAVLMIISELTFDLFDATTRIITIFAHTISNRTVCDDPNSLTSV